MKRWMIWLGMLLLSAALAACSQATLPAIPSPKMVLPSATARASSPTPDPRPTLTATLAPLPTQTPVPTQTQAPTKAVNYCVSCHTDKDTLIKNLKPVEEKPKESVGAG